MLQMILSYLIQLSIALINLALTILYRLIRGRPDRNRQTPSTTPPTDKKQRNLTTSQASATLKPLPSVPSHHLQNFLRYISDFHKLQCYYSITLQAGTLIALYGPLHTTHSIPNPFDDAFLLLLSINGILPVSLMYYTLALSENLSVYHISLTCVSAILASTTGITLVNLLSAPPAVASKTRGYYIDWPASTGSQAPEAICGRTYAIRYPDKLKPEKVFLVGAALCDAFLVIMISKWLLARCPSLLPTTWLRNQSHRLSSPSRSLTSGKTPRWARIGAYIVTAFIFIYYSAMEYFFFYQMLVPQYARIVNFQDWGFGQIVGIAVWAVVIIDLARHEIGKLSDSLERASMHILSPELC